VARGMMLTTDLHLSQG